MSLFSLPEIKLWYSQNALIKEMVTNLSRTCWKLPPLCCIKTTEFQNQNGGDNLFLLHLVRSYYLFLSFIPISLNSSSLVCCSCFSLSALVISAILSALTGTNDIILSTSKFTALEINTSVFHVNTYRVLHFLKHIYLFCLGDIFCIYMRLVSKTL